jgi:hypothetical protein
MGLHWLGWRLRLQGTFVLHVARSGDEIDHAAIEQIVRLCETRGVGASVLLVDRIERPSVLDLERRLLFAGRRTVVIATAIPVRTSKQTKVDDEVEIEPARTATQEVSVPFALGAEERKRFEEFLSANGAVNARKIMEEYGASSSIFTLLYRLVPDARPGMQQILVNEFDSFLRLIELFKPKLSAPVRGSSLAEQLSAYVASGKLSSSSPADHVDDAVHAPDAALAAFVSRHKTSHLDERSIDKLAIIVGYAREAFSQGVSGHEVDFSSLRRLPKDVLVALVSTVRCGDKAAELPRIGEKIGRLVAARLALGDTANIEIDEMITLFEPLIGTMPAGVGPRSYRLWVEGDTDLRLLQLTAGLSGADWPLLSGLEIGLIGTGGRGGGTSRLPETIARERTSPDWDLFLFDNDESGREAGALISKLGQRSLILPLQLAASASEDNIEIEDLVSVECLDQFYEGECNLSPESELLVYGTNERRRLVVRGIDKEQLVQWMQNNAKLDDVQNLVRLLKHVRWMFGLAYGEELPKSFMPSTLSERCRLGRRPKPWWYVSSLTK